MEPVLVAFVPGLHKGYIDLFKSCPQELFLFGNSIIEDYTALSRDLRIVDPEEMQKAIRALDIFGRVSILEHEDLESFAVGHPSIVMPLEDVSLDLQHKYFSKNTVAFRPVHLRFDKIITLQETVVPPHRTISSDALHRDIALKSEEESQKSFDWWRQVGCVAVKDGAIVAQGHNRVLPNNFHIGEMGDPRSNFDAGTNPDIYLTLHAEASVIADCAKRGVSLNGASMFLNTFACANCARLLAMSGVKKVYYTKGYSRFDAEDILKAFGIDIVLVQ